LTKVAVKHLKIADQVVGALQEWLRSGELTPGMRLPPERELAARLGVSRTSLRDALRRLELLGYLDARQGDGTYVRVPGAEAVAQPFRNLVRTVPQNAADLLEFRMLLEPEVAALAAARLTPQARQELADSLSRQLALKDEDPNLIHEDALFHDALARAAGNTVVLRVLETLRDLLRDVRATALPAAGSSRTVSEHGRIIRAVMAQDEDAARHTMRGHLQDVTRTYQKAVESLRQSGSPLPDSRVSDSQPPNTQPPMTQPKGTQTSAVSPSENPAETRPVQPLPVQGVNP
jgi:GntR family transcriptional repressor for pyruvate dehydrogenase complex